MTKKYLQTIAASSLALGSLYPVQSNAGEALRGLNKTTECGGCPPNNCPCGINCGCLGHVHDYFTHAPIGVMGDHMHSKGGLMASYRYMFMSMQRNYDGDSQITDADAREGYMMNATDMDMQMHMIGVMYAPSDKLTLGLMANYRENEMGMINMMGVKSTMESSGYGDVTLTGLFSLYKKSNSSLHAGLGVSIPTGSIDEEMPNGRHVGYPMQLGSGTWDLKPSVTWISSSDYFAYGAQLSGVIRTGENDNGYTLGDSISATAWVNHRVTEQQSISLRLTVSSWSNIDGEDPDVPRIMMGPLAGQPMAAVGDADARGGTRIDISAGYNIWSANNNMRFGLELGTPVYQKLDGPQLGVEWFTTLGFQFSW